LELCNADRYALATTLRRSIFDVKCTVQGWTNRDDFETQAKICPKPDFAVFEDSPNSRGLRRYGVYISLLGAKFPESLDSVAFADISVESDDDDDDEVKTANGSPEVVDNGKGSTEQSVESLRGEIEKTAVKLVEASGINEEIERLERCCQSQAPTGSWKDIVKTRMAKQMYGLIKIRDGAGVDKSSTLLLTKAAESQQPSVLLDATVVDDDPEQQDDDDDEIMVVETVAVASKSPERQVDGVGTKSRESQDDEIVVDNVDTVASKSPEGQVDGTKSRKSQDGNKINDDEIVVDNVDTVASKSQETLESLIDQIIVIDDDGVGAKSQESQGAGCSNQINDDDNVEKVKNSSDENDKTTQEKPDSTGENMSMIDIEAAEAMFSDDDMTDESGQQQQQQQLQKTGSSIIMTPKNQQPPRLNTQPRLKRSLKGPDWPTNEIFECGASKSPQVGVHHTPKTSRQLPPPPPQGRGQGGHRPRPYLLRQHPINNLQALGSSPVLRLRQQENLVVTSVAATAATVATAVTAGAAVTSPPLRLTQQENLPVTRVATATTVASEPTSIQSGFTIVLVPSGCTKRIKINDMNITFWE
jgi:hypothetical protein